MRLSEEEIALLLGKPGYRVIDTNAPRGPAEPSTPQEVPAGVLSADAMPEGLLLARIRRLALDHSYLAYHTHDSRRSELGFPDVCLARAATATSPGRLIFAELKAQQGKVTREQAIWLDVLRHTVPGIESYLWRPSDWSTITAIITRST